MSGRLWLACVFSSELAAATGSPCGPCHSAIEASYGGSGMARTFSSDIGAVGDWERRNSYYHGASDRWYRLFRKDGAYYVRRWQKGYRDAETNVFEARIEYAVGSGEHARSFLYKAVDGRLFELPVSWYAGEGGHWAMSPGFDHASHTDFRREVSAACLFCHAAYDARAPIDCERCHGRLTSRSALAARSLTTVSRAGLNPHAARRPLRSWSTEAGRSSSSAAGWMTSLKSTAPRTGCGSPLAKA